MDLLSLPPSQLRSYVLAHGIPDSHAHAGGSSVRGGLWRRWLSVHSKKAKEAEEGSEKGREQYYALLEGVLGRLSVEQGHEREEGEGEEPRMGAAIKLAAPS
ncbi:hypothetical protein BT69DRAFT_1359084 [Atractiella rhizophila]|nr:hypothetical protein BT69DRAFT_1359084 [Atractiella rhizophila]